MSPDDNAGADAPVDESVEEQADRLHPTGANKAPVEPPRIKPPREFSDAQLKANPILAQFAYEHLESAAFAKAFVNMAGVILLNVKHPEACTAALHKLNSARLASLRGI